MPHVNGDKPTREERLHEVLLAYTEAEERGETPDQAKWLAHHPEFATELRQYFANRERMRVLAGPLRAVQPDSLPTMPPHGEPASTDLDFVVTDAVQQFPRRFAEYDLLGNLGRGGMGVVYKARDRRLNRIVALKLILAGTHAGTDALERFRREAEAVARLNHPNIVQVYEVGEEAGQPYITLEYLAGGNLAERIGNKPQAPRWAAGLIATLAEAISEVHQSALVHRDLKPGNILLTLEGQPKINDFGLAKFLDDGKEMTVSGAIVGTPEYMSPEQAEGKRKKVGPAADVYALGAILYKLLTGDPPFHGDTQLDTVMQVMVEDPLPPHTLASGIPRDLEAICLKCLEKQPHDRYTDARALARDLRRYLRGEAVHARPQLWWGHVWLWCRRNPSWAFCILAVVLGTCWGVGQAIWTMSNYHRTMQQWDNNQQPLRDMFKRSRERYQQPF
jgi:serine/threonine-protein kinase